MWENEVGNFEQGQNQSLQKRADDSSVSSPATLGYVTKDVRRSLLALVD
jgi:hypothetical protein